MNSNIRLILGISLLVIGVFLPLAVYPVVHSDWPLAAKTAVSGIFTFGFEILAIPAVAIMGKENFDRLMKGVKGWFGKLKPAGTVGRTRYNVGLLLFIMPIVPTYIMAYFPRWLPDYSLERLMINISADVIFLVSLFVLGGDFWDKLRSLFVRESKAVFPKKSKLS
ncbi:MAG: hypothetical protein WCV63_10440 [Negativicutes bacterium]|jgi:membrane protease YdiL (CAAX protease family)